MVELADHASVAQDELLVAIATTRPWIFVAVDSQPGVRGGWVQWRAMRRCCGRSRVSAPTPPRRRLSSTCGRDRGPDLLPSHDRAR